MAGYRIFRCQILVLSKIWGQHTEAPWNFACAHMFSFFLASIIEIGKWTLRLGVQRVSGGHIPSCGCGSTCVWGSHSKLWLWFNVCLNATFQVVVVVERVSGGHIPSCGCGCGMWPPDTRWTPNLKIHFPISNIGARKKLNIWAHAEFQGASVCWPQILRNTNIWQRKIRWPAISLWFQLS